MNTLTTAELRRYPGRTFTEQVKSHHEERAARPAAGEASRAEAAPLRSPARPGASHGALHLGRRIDISRVTGRDRVERVANYLRVLVPRASTWSEEALREVAERLLRDAVVVE